MLIFRLLAGFAVLGLSTLQASGQGRGGFKADWDVAQFASPEPGTRVDHLLAFDISTLPFSSDSTGLTASMPVRIQFVSVEGGPGSTPDTEAVLRFTVADPSQVVPGRQFLHHLSSQVPPGSYRLSLILGEGLLARPRLSERELVIRDFDAEAVMLSDVLLASDIRATRGSAAAYERNGLSFQPNPKLLFGRGLPVLYYYAEAYGVDSTEGGSQFHAFVTETHLSSPLLDLENRSPINGETGAVFGSFDLSGLPNGSYRLIVRVTGSADELAAEQEARFFVYNPGVSREAVTASAAGAGGGIAGIMNEEELAEHFEMIAVIATEDEKRRMRRLGDDDERRRFVDNFWETRRTASDITGSVTREEFDLRLQYADERYGNRNREGWETDRGRVLVKYGIPDDIEDQDEQGEMAAYSVWSYTNIPGIGPGFFVFGDLMGFNNFELIHANVPGERQSIDWQSELRRYR